MRHMWLTELASPLGVWTWCCSLQNKDLLISCHFYEGGGWNGRDLSFFLMPSPNNHMTKDSVESWKGYSQ
jgi:hypothetical protein